MMRSFTRRGGKGDTGAARKPAGMAAWISSGMLLASLAGCAVGPRYVRPEVEIPQAFKEQAGADGWKLAQPADLPGAGPWWTLFGDPQLDSLERKVEISNQNVKTAEANFRQAQATVKASTAALFPVLSASASSNRSSGGAGPLGTGSGMESNQTLSFGVSWDTDVWGRLRSAVESSRASAQASANDLAAARLSMQVNLAQDYFQLRGNDAQRQLLERTLEAYQKSLDLTRNRHAGGIATEADVAQAETLLESTRAQAIDLGIQRSQLEHAIALLTGQPASSFALPLAPLTTAAPPRPAFGLPSQLLERRPDVAAAERHVAAANAQIGVARAAFFPSLTLSASGGFSGAGLAGLLAAPNHFWALGAALAATLFDGGARTAQYEQARAAFDATVATYRQTVLQSFQEVEDDLAQLRILEQEMQVQEAALRAARRSAEIAVNQYKAGIVPYLNVTTAQAAALTSERNVVTVAGNRMVATVLLTAALGGGWENSP